jgi:ubiquinone/menaquinone biosynthesis C-methylase UbiE
MAIYQKIGQDYDRTRRADPYITTRLAFHLRISTNCRYLDIACGTGNYTHAMAALGGAWHGVDPSATMIAQAAQKRPLVHWVTGEADGLPYLDGAFAGAICTLAIHHFDALDLAFREIHRVIADGRLVLFTSTPDQIRRYWLAEYFPEAIRKSADQMPGVDTLTASLERSGFRLLTIENYSVQVDLQDLFLYSGKWRPEIYLDPTVRAGISTFALLASDWEVQVGCGRLASDIESGEIANVIHAYRHNAGDYVFLVGEKGDERQQLR